MNNSHILIVMNSTINAVRYNIVTDDYNQIYDIQIEANQNHKNHFVFSLYF